MKKVLLITCPIVVKSAYSNYRALILFELETQLCVRKFLFPD